ncbi:MAG: hypothetical protein OXC02_10365 [Rhodobacteraceae bacterium]|nr:hypothetical protein [Paracoccaceae bacterium]
MAILDRHGDVNQKIFGSDRPTLLTVTPPNTMVGNHMGLSVRHVMG